MHSHSTVIVEASVGLVELVVVMGEHQVDSARVNVKLSAQLLRGDGGALDVPARTAYESKNENMKEDIREGMEGGGGGLEE